MVSVIIAAHDEEAVITRCLDAVARGGVAAQIIVSANGCTDATAALARAHPIGAAHQVQVVDRPEAGKAGALNAAERLATRYPRVYLDADIVPPPGALAALARALEQSTGVLAVVPRRRVDATGRPWAVRAYFHIHERLPAFHAGLFGRGLIAVSETGRARFAAFPELVADDLFLDSQFVPAEKRQVDDVEVVIEAPHTTRALLRRLVRVRRGNTQLRRAVGSVSDVRRSDRWSWLRDVVRHDARLLPDAAAYVVLTAAAGVASRRSGADWGRDSSTRERAPRAKEGRS